nr:hypothetical protein [Oscillochloris trichoides]
MRLILPSMPTGEADRVILRTSNGNRERFSSLGGGQYEAFPGVYGTLVESGGNFVLTQRDQSMLTFDATTGLLQLLTNQQGEEVELVYSGSKLTQVRDAANTQRALTLIYDTSDPDLIASVSALQAKTQARPSGMTMIAWAACVKRSTPVVYHLTTSAMIRGEHHRVVPSHPLALRGSCKIQPQGQSISVRGGILLVWEYSHHAIVLRVSQSSHIPSTSTYMPSAIPYCILTRQESMLN